MPRRQAENTEKNNQKERRVMSQKERVDLIEVDLLDMCKYILSKWVFILIGMVVFAGAGFGYAKVKSVTEYSSKMQVYVTVPKTSDKVVIRDNVNELTTDYIKLLGTDLFTKGIADKTNLSKDELKNMIYAEAVDGTRVIEIKVKSENKNAVKKVSKLVIPSFQKMEAGASVYSASKLATEEFPNFDVGQRSATSIARRVQDPLAELVKIEPKAIGVGQYQHDMNQKQLTEALGGVVEATVNKVGVDLNTASASLLEYVSGVSKTVAKNIVAYREENGTFRNRKQLLKVAKLGPKAFEQCAGFLRVSGGDEPLDATGVHPETYKETGMLLKNLGYSTKELSKEGFKGISSKITDYKKLSEELGIGEITLKDIVKELEKPGRDPREDLPKPILRTDVLEMKDLKPGMKLKGTVRNVIDFGAFVDIGVHQDGLVHISQMADRFIKHPLEVVSVGDVVDVVVVSVDIDKKRIQLSMKN